MNSYDTSSSGKPKLKNRNQSIEANLPTNHSKQLVTNKLPANEKTVQSRRSIASDSEQSSPQLSGICESCSPYRTVPIVIHVTLFLTFVGTFAYGIWSGIGNRQIPLTDYLYLTHWNLSFQVFFCTLEIFADLSARFADATTVFRAKLYHSIVFPFSMFVCTFFWTLCAIDEQLVRPKNLTERPEDWYNHVVHTLIVPAAMLQGMASYYRPSGLIESLTITVVCGFIYSCWSIMFGILFDVWSYELFHNISNYGLLLLLFFSAILLCAFNSLGRVIHQTIWTMHNAHHQT